MMTSTNAFVTREARAERLRRMADLAYRMANKLQAFNLRGNAAAAQVPATIAARENFPMDELQNAVDKLRQEQLALSERLHALEERLDALRGVVNRNFGRVTTALQSIAAAAKK